MFRETRFIIIILADFIVPRVDWQGCSEITSSQVFTVWSTRMNQLYVVTIEVCSSIGSSVVGKLAVPHEWVYTVESTLGIMLLENFVVESLIAKGWNRCA